MNFLYPIRAFLAKILRIKGPEQRRSRRDPTYIEVMYMTCNDAMISGNAKVMNVNKGGLCLDLDHVIEPNLTLAVTINPHVVIKYLKMDEIMKDERGRCLFMVQWIKDKDGEEGCYAGGYFMPQQED